MDASLVVQASTSGDYRAPQSARPVLAESTIPCLVNLDDTRSELGAEILEAEPHIGAGHVHRTLFSGRLFSLKNNKKKRTAGTGTTGNWGGRMFDYEQKYEVDEWGAEMGPESRFCKMYVDETEIYDLERVDSWRDVLDVLLVFIGLFSAIVTTFVIQTSQALQPDYGQLTATLVYNLVLVQRALANGTIDSVTLPKNPADPSISPSSIEKWINGLWFTSLAISLSTALVTVLTKQWLYHYMSQTSGTSRDRARLRQFRFAGLEKYRVPMIIDLLPVALHLALALFLVGLALFLYTLDRGISAIVIVISGTAYISYLVSALLPLYDTQCPYQSPISAYLYHLKVFATPGARAVERGVAQGMILCSSIWISFRGRVAQVLHLEYSRDPDQLESYEDITKAIESRPSPAATLSAQERDGVLEQCHQLDIDAITWLFSTSSNSTVRKISYMASVGLIPSAANTSKLRDVVYQSYYGLSPLRIEGLIYPHMEHIAACIDGVYLNAIGSAPLEVVPVDEADGYRVFSSLIFPILSRNLHTSSDRYKPLVLTDFLGPGPRAHLRLPLSVWKLCIDELAMSSTALDPIMVTRLLQRTVPQRVDISSHSPATFADAMISNSHLQSPMLDLIATKLGVERDSVASLTSIPLLESIMTWAVPHLDKCKVDIDSLWGEKPYETAILLVYECLEHHHSVLSGLPMDGIIHLRDRCSEFLSHALIFESSAIQWKAYFISANLLFELWEEHPSLPCPTELLSSLLSCCTTAAPSDQPFDPNEETVEEYRALRVIPQILEGSEGDARVIYYNMLREHDILPITLASSWGDESYIYHVWTMELCHVAVFWLRDTVDTTREWAQNWIRYIDTPERLSFIFKRLLCGYKLRVNPELSYRVSPLLQFAAACANWSAAFPSLIALLEDDTFMTSIEHCENPRYQLSSVLLEMREPSTLTSVDLSMYIIPLFDEQDHKIVPNATPSVPVEDDSVAPPSPEAPNHSPEQSDLNPPQPTSSDHGSSSQIATMTKVWNKTKAIIHFAKPLVPRPEQTPKEMEEGEP